MAKLTLEKSSFLADLIPVTNGLLLRMDFSGPFSEDELNFICESTRGGGGGGGGGTYKLNKTAHFNNMHVRFLTSTVKTLKNLK